MVQVNNLFCIPGLTKCNNNNSVSIVFFFFMACTLIVGSTNVVHLVSSLSDLSSISNVHKCFIKICILWDQYPNNEMVLLKSELYFLATTMRCMVLL